MCRKVLLIFILIVFSFRNYSQTLTNANQPMVPQPIPPSPTAASLGKYGETPVSKYTGIPDITIPIWQIKEGDIQVPISLAYHSGGVKVEENASWVGLGWSLNAGGVITRAVRGQPDEVGYLINTVSAGGRDNLMPPLLRKLVELGPTASVCDVKDAAFYASNVASGGFDSEPDLYYFNFNGISGKFVLDQNGVAYTIPFQKLKIERLAGIGWRITTPDGMQYSFGANGSTEYTQRTSISYSVYGGAEGDFPTSGSPFASSWYLSTIQSTTGHSISLSYTNESYQVYSGQSQYLMWDISNATNFNAANVVSTTGSKSQIGGVRLSNISFSNGHVDFIATKIRQDIDDYSNPNLLEKIVVSNTQGPIRNFNLNTDYITSNDGIVGAASKRLRLNSIVESSGDLTVSKPPYLFSYDSSGAIPSKISASQDHWGFYNGKANLDVNHNPTLIPDVQTGLLNFTNAHYYNGYSTTLVTDTYYSSGLSLLHYTGADRTPDFNFAKIGVLNKVIYPTGGYTLFEYEPNDYDLKPGNYIYSRVQQVLQSNCTSAPTPPAADSVVCSNGVCHSVKTVNLSQYINSGNSGVNQTIAANLSFYFNNAGQNFYCCGYSEPEATFRDVTTNTVLLYIQGREGIPQTIASSIQSQIDNGTVQLEGNFNYTYNGGQQVWNPVPYFKFSNVQLDPTHTYELKTTTYSSAASDCEFNANCPKPASDLYSNSSLQMTFFITTNTIIEYNGTIGGLRIKKISDFSNLAAPVIKHYAYTLSANPLLSSGVIQDMPIYIDQGRKNSNILNAGAPFDSKNNATNIPAFLSANSTKFLTLTSGSKFELGQTSGNFVGYKEVQEYFCSDTLCTGSPVGYKIYKFTSSDDYPDINTQEFGYAFWSGYGTYGCSSSTTYDLYQFDLHWADPAEVFISDNQYPYPPKNNYDWKRGLPTSEEFYDNTGRLIKKIESSYNLVTDTSNSKVLPGLKIVTVPKSRISDMFFGRYDIVAAWNYKTQDKVTEIDAAGNQLVNSTNYYYDNPGLSLLTRTEMTNSKNQLLQATYNYPSDFSTQAPYDAMISRYQLNPAIVQTRRNNGIFLESTTTNYKNWGNGIITPETIQTTLQTNPIDTRIHFYKYDNLGNLLVASKEKDMVLTYVYDYQNNYPIAEIKNSNGDTVAYTSFEADGTGNWTISSLKLGITGGITGNNFDTVATGATISKSGLPSTRNYLVTYWSKNGPLTISGTAATSGLAKKGWTYYQHVLPSGSTSVSISGSGIIIDELRLYPTDAQMTTCTYTPLVGMTSACSPNNLTSYYEYDGLGRLLRLRDLDGNIIKQYDYQYQVSH